MSPPTPCAITKSKASLAVPSRQENGYRAYTSDHVAAMRFVRGAQSLRFSLTEIREILPQFALGQLGRTDIEQQLQTKMAEIDTHILQLKNLKNLKKELQSTFESLIFAPHQVVTTAQVTAADSGSGAGAARARKSLANPSTQ